MKIQAQKTARVAGCLNYLVWRNKYTRKDTKSEVYRAATVSLRMRVEGGLMQVRFIEIHQVYAKQKKSDTFLTE